MDDDLLTADADILTRLAGPPLFWVADVPNHSRSTRTSPPRQPFYDAYSGIRRSGIYLLRDALGPEQVYYVGIAPLDPITSGTKNPKADGVIGRLSTHRNMDGSADAPRVLVRWYQFTHPNEPLPSPLSIEGRDRIRDAARGRVGVTFAPTTEAMARRLERAIIGRGLPGQNVPPLLNYENWKHRPRAAATGN